MSTLRIGRCSACRRGWHPVPPLCPACRGAVAEEPASGLGRVVSWTQVERPPTGFVGPQRIALVALQTDAQDEDVLVLAAATEDALQVGTEVQVTASTDGRLRAKPR